MFLKNPRGHYLGWKTSVCTFKIPTKDNHSDAYYIENISKNLVLGVTNNGAVSEQILDLLDVGQNWLMEINPRREHRGITIITHGGEGKY